MPQTGFDNFKDLRNNGGIHPNPIFDFLSGYVPKNLKAMLVWAEYLVFNSPHIYTALQKLSEYTITDFTYDTDDPDIRKRYKKLLETKLHAKRFLKAVARDRGIYGNVFVSVYYPFRRSVRCTHEGCQQQYNIQYLEYHFSLDKLTFKWKCEACGNSVITHLDDVKDTKTPDPSKINLIRWDPKAMSISSNPITGEESFSYKVTSDVTSRLKEGSKFLINTMPKEFIKAARKDNVFTFKKGKIYHLKVDAPAGIDTAWGLPPLVAVLKQFFYTAMLRKANEAVAMEHILPFRVLHPGQGSANGDPIQALSLSRWTEETKQNIKKWRRDPLHIMFSSVPLGVTRMGGDGRAMLTLGEIEAAENNIMAAMGIPREFLYGGLTFAGSSVTLRMLENQLLSTTKELEEMLTWIAEGCADFLGWEKVQCKLVPFKLIDDVQQKEALMSLTMNGDMVSKTTLVESFGLDIEGERDKRLQETIAEVKFQSSVQDKINSMENSITQQAQEASNTQPLNYDQQQIIAQADQIVQQITPLDYGQRRSFLESLNNEDAIMHAVVVQRMEEQNKMLASQARTEARKTAGMGS